MSSVCPACQMPLVDGVLRCRFCGVDAREAEAAPGVGAAFSVREVAPEALRAAELVDEMEQLAPPVAAWWRSADGPRRRRLAEILGDIRDMLRRR